MPNTNSVFYDSPTWTTGYLHSDGSVGASPHNSYTNKFNCEGYDYLTVLAAVWRTVEPCCQFFGDNDVFLESFHFEKDTNLNNTPEKIYFIRIPTGAKTFRTTCYQNYIGKWFALLATDNEYKSIVDNHLYSYKTIRPTWSGGNCINTIDSSVGIQVRFGKLASNALSLFHTKIFNVRPSSRLTISGADQTTALTLICMDDNYIVQSISVLGIPLEGDIKEFLTENVSKIIIQGKREIQVDNGDNTTTTYYYEPNIQMSICLQTGNETAFFPSPEPSTSENIRYQHLTMKIELSDMSLNSNNSNGNPNLQKEYAADHGILALPNSYSPDGNPTKLIIFTHGSAVFYNYSHDKFDDDDIKPHYWLSEGYAIMDMDGLMTGNVDIDTENNPDGVNYGVNINHDKTKTGNSNGNRNHYYEPDSINSYQTAYNWVIKHYNIKTDGVFSVGRSMGGGMQFVLAKSSTIPIIASAAIVPSVSPLGYFSAPVSKQTRQDLFNAVGANNVSVFTTNVKRYYKEIGGTRYYRDDYTEANISDYININAKEQRQYYKFTELTQAERQCIIENQWRFVQFTPGFMFNRPLTLQEVDDWESGYRNQNVNALQNFFDSVKDSINVSIFRNIPFIIFTCVNDPMVWFEGVKLQHKLLTYGGANAILRVYPTCGSDPHRFEIQDVNKVFYTNSKGQNMTVPKVYVEINNFWRKYNK